MLGSIATFAQVISVVVAVVISILSFNNVREIEADARRVESAKPFLDLRQKYYTEALEKAAILSNPETHTPAELSAAKIAFRDLYVTKLSMVETPEVAQKMVALAAKIDPSLTNFTPAQQAAYELARTLSQSFVSDYQLKE